MHLCRQPTLLHANGFMPTREVGLYEIEADYPLCRRIRHVDADLSNSS